MQASEREIGEGWRGRQRVIEAEGEWKLTSSDGVAIYQSDDVRMGNEDEKTGSEWIRRLHLSHPLQSKIIPELQSGMMGKREKLN